MSALDKSSNKLPGRRVRKLMEVRAETTRGKLYYSLDGELWNEGDKVTITKDAVVCFVAIDSHGIASEVVSKSFGKAEA